jgi:paraquat-inducible protein A
MPAAAISAPAAAPSPAQIIACHECDLLQDIGRVRPGERAVCIRCGATLVDRKHDPIEKPLLLYLTALILLVLANLFPFLTVRIEGRMQPSLFVSGALDLYRSGMPELAVVVVLFMFVFPLTKILSALSVLVPLRFGRRPAMARPVFRLVDVLGPWAMMEVFLLGVLVAYVKLVDLATVIVGPSLYCFVGVIAAMAAADFALDPHAVWERLQPSPPLRLPPPGERRRLVSCHVCQRLSMPDATGAAHAAECPRCAAALHRRKPDSINRAWALLLTALILYIPANVYPVMTVTMFGRGEPDTILSGVKELIGAGMWPLAMLIFFASIVVPVLKILGLIYLLVSVQQGSRRRLRERTRLYRIVESVGRWSMVDIFVLAILVALVQIGSIATIEPGFGAMAFSGVVVITMFAAISFDPRLIWDNAGANDDR